MKEICKPANQARPALMNRHLMLIILLLVSCIPLISCKWSCPLIKREMPIQPSASSEAKLAALTKWIPSSTNAIIVIDSYRLANSSPWEDITRMETFKFLDRLREHGINLKSDVGMFAILMEFVTSKNMNGPVLLIQGGFHQDLIVSKIKDQAKKDKLELTPEDYKGHIIYSEKESDKETSVPYSFAAMGDGVIAVATTENLKWLIDNKPKKSDLLSKLAKDIDWENPITGRMALPEDMRASLPAPWNAITGVQLEANIAEDIHARISINSSGSGEVEKIKSALEGFKAIEAIQHMDDKKTLDKIEKILIVEKRGKIIIDIPEDTGLLELALAKLKEVEGKTNGNQHE